MGSSVAFVVPGKLVARRNCLHPPGCTFCAWCGFDRRNRRHTSPLFWPVPFGAVPNAPTGWHVADIIEDLSTHAEIWPNNVAPMFNRHPDAQPLDLEPHDADLGGAAPEAPVGRVGGLGGVAAAVAEVGEDGQSVEGSADGGEWPEGLVGVALRVSEQHAKGLSTGYEWVITPVAHVATQHHGVQRVRLVAPVKRLERVWAWQLEGCEEMEPGTAAEVEE